MRLRTRTFLLCFAPVALMLTLSFWTIQSIVQSRVHDELRASLRDNHRSIARLRAKNDLRNSRFLRVVGENASLKAGLQLLISQRDAHGRILAQQTVEDQLRELGEHMGFDFMMVRGPDGRSLAGVLRVQENQLVPVNVSAIHDEHGGLVAIEDRLLQIASVPVDQGPENIGALAVGEFFDFNEFSTPAVLIQSGKVVRSNLPGFRPGELDASFRGCSDQTECDVRLAGETWISLPMQNMSSRDDYVVRSLQNVDAAAGPIRHVLQRVFAIASLGILLLATIGSLVSARSIAGPIASVVAHLRKAESTGMLPGFNASSTGIHEMRELTETFSRAAASVHEARENLQSAYVEFVGSLASALDARDPYTAGHSARVGNFSRAVAEALGLPPADVDRIHIGALLHDIGKIGVSDTVLQKPGRLTAEEFALVKLHPEIGRRILEGVHGFAPYLAAVELHHENWDGTGVSQGKEGGQAGYQTPVDARIIHVADAYDAMTTDRPYRPGMTHERAIHVILANAGQPVRSGHRLGLRPIADPRESRNRNS